MFFSVDFNSSGRGYAIGIEILSSETDEMLSKKLLNYPKEINWYSIRTLKDLKNLNLL